MPSSLLRAGIAALRDRSRGAVAALTGGAGVVSAAAPEAVSDAVTSHSDEAIQLGPLGWSALLRSLSLSAVSDVRRLLIWVVACVLVLVLVAITCPNESSFRAHLTELAFRRHLAHIRSSDEPEAAETARANGSSGADTPPIAPFRFANHVAITLRTPSLCFRSYFFFALAFSAAPGPPAFLSDPVPTKPPKHASPSQPEPAVAYFGILGHWFILGHVPALLSWVWRVVRLGRRGKARKKASALDRPGVMEMRAVPPKDEPARSIVPKLLFNKSDSHKDLTDLLPLHTTPSLPPNGTQSRRGSVNLAPPSIPPPPPPDQPEIEITSPVLTALKVELASAQSVLSELQSQLIAHDESVASSQAHLQSTLDELRSRRKADDTERQDLKSKTKTLEDQKRQAEGARRDAEKRLKTAESARSALQAKIAATLGEIEDLKGNMELSGENVKIVKEEGARHVVETRQAVKDKTKELGDLENEVTELETAIDTLCKQVQDAEEQLKSAEETAATAHKIAPEEEMMLMAAAYEVAASESYHHGQRQNQADSQWASQAAAYMAEAGFPHLDQSYTARPKNATAGYGHLSRAHPNNASYRSLTDKRMADVPGFEDFGPGPRTRSLATLQNATPPSNDEEEHGSPNGTIGASFPDSWLPLGLVRSLEGDITPLEGASDVNDEDLSDMQDVLALGPPEGEQPSPTSDSGDDSPNWPIGEEARRATHNRFAMNGSVSSLPGIGSLPAGSRRWFSTSPSSENVSAFNPFNSGVPGVGSSDSLPGFDSAFAPSASEKRALKWPLLGKSRWSGNGNRSISGLDEITAGLKRTGGGGAPPLSAGPGASFGLSPPSFSAEELFNRAPADGASLDLATGGSWPRTASHGSGSGSGQRFYDGLSSPSESPELGFDGGSGGGEDEGGLGGHPVPERKPSFRFFSLRKGA